MDVGYKSTAEELERITRERDEARAERDAAMREIGPALAKIGELAIENARLREVLDEVVKRLVPLMPVILAAMQAKKGIE